ncbi:MAG: hypothetical protein HY718_04360 [Planctomycetes bacterium]|nr:hypothetical protein [Planctomycetota bacterium]
MELIRRLGEQEVHRRLAAENKSYARKHFDVSAILPQIEALFAGARTDAVTFPALRLVPLYDGRDELVRLSDRQPPLHSGASTSAFGPGGPVCDTTTCSKG